MQTSFAINDNSKFNNFVDPSLIAGAVQAVSQIGTAGINLATKSGLQGDVKAACGPKPLFNFGGRKDAYLACTQAYTKANATQQNYQNQAATQLAQMQLALAAQAQSKKLSTGAWVGIIAGSALILGLTTFLIIKN